MTPKNFSELLLSIGDLPIKIGGKSTVLLYENKIYLVFSVFMLILLDNIHLLTSSSSLFIISTYWGISMAFLGKQVDKVLSSANKINLNKLDELGRSLMKIRKRSGPKFDP